MLSMLVYFSNSTTCSVSGCSTTRITALTSCYYIRTEDIHRRLFQLPRLNSLSHALNSHSHPMADFTPIPMGSQSSPFPCTPLRHTRQDKTVCRPPPPRRRPGRQLHLAARDRPHAATLYPRKCKHAVYCCVRLNLIFFTKRHATRVIHRLTVQTLPDGLETQFTPPDTTQAALSRRVWWAV